MATITIIGKGNMGKAIASVFEAAGNTIQFVDSRETVGNLADIVVLAVPYSAVASIVQRYKDQLKGKMVVDITNPVNFETFDDMVVPADSSAAAQIAVLLPDSVVVKCFNTTFAATLTSGKVAGRETTAVMLASDSEEAKKRLSAALEGSGLMVIDAGGLKRARELEAMGFLQITLAARDQVGWTGGFAVLA